MARAYRLQIAIIVGVISFIAFSLALASHPAGPAGYWAFDENGGATAFDSSGHGNDGAINGSAAYTTVGIAPVGGNVSALTFDGADDFVAVANDSNLDMTAAYSVSVWANITDVATYRPIVLRGTTDADDIEVYVQVSSGDLVVAHNRGNGGVFDFVGFDDPPAGLFHLAITFDGTDVMAYYNGVAATVVQQSTAMAAPLDTDKDWWFGKVDHTAFTGTFFFSGLLDELQLFSRALDGSEVATLAAGSGELTVTKIVVNNNGGTATTTDFVLFIDTATTTSGTATTSSPGAHVVSETNIPGYTAIIGGDCDASGNVTIAAGESKECTITNDDEPATLIVIKHVINDNGGTATSSAFTLDSGGANDSPDDFAGEEAPGTTVTLDAGAYNVTEVGPPPSGYAQSFSADCSGTIANGETKTCTVTNDDVAGTLIVRKVLINDNGGTRATTTFMFRVNGGAATAFEADGQNNISVNAGTYTVVEDAAVGYLTSYSNSNNLNADCDNLAVAIGESVECVITNNDVLPPPADACTTLIVPVGYTLQNGTAGNDVVLLAPFTMFLGNGGNDRVIARTGNYIICTLGGKDIITLNGNGAVTIDAGAGDNIIAAPGTMTGFITTGSGKDVISLGSAVHTVNAGDGKNIVTTGNGDQTITTGSGDDTIITSGGNDTVDAGAGKNKVITRAGNDSLTAGAGNDFFDAGAGADICNAGGGSNTVLNCAP